jgi:head-tail adaptor
MSYLAPTLKHRIQIRKAVQTPNDAGGADQTYETITTLWADIKGMSDYIKAVRGANGQDADSHRIKVRTCGVMNLGRAFSVGYVSGYKGEDIYPLKADYFIFDQKGVTTKGRLFRITGVRLDEDDSEFVEMTAKEIEETGTGYPS